MSISSSSTRRPYDSPCEYTYPHYWCPCENPNRTRTIAEVSADQLSTGKLYYSCPKCMVFAGWLVPLRPGEILHLVERDYQPDRSTVSPSPLLYKRATCKRVGCKCVATILVSSSTDNPGKLYYSCTGCGRFVGWCIPIGRADEVNQPRCTSDEMYPGRTGAVEFNAITEIGKMAARLVILNVVIVVLLVITLLCTLFK